MIDVGHQRGKPTRLTGQGVLGDVQVDRAIPTVMVIVRQLPRRFAGKEKKLPRIVADCFWSKCRDPRDCTGAKILRDWDGPIIEAAAKASNLGQEEPVELVEVEWRFGKRDTHVLPLPFRADVPAQIASWIRNGRIIKSCWIFIDPNA
jgi:hypothetical protein